MPDKRIFSAGQIYMDAHFVVEMQNIDQAVDVYRNEKELYYGIRVECLTAAEAERLRKYVDETYPEIQFQFSWLEFRMP